VGTEPGREQSGGREVGTETTVGADGRDGGSVKRGAGWGAGWEPWGRRRREVGTEPGRDGGDAKWGRRLSLEGHSSFEVGVTSGCLTRLGVQIFLHQVQSSIVQNEGIT
jgi:hypothetical protein